MSQPPGGAKCGRREGPEGLHHHGKDHGLDTRSTADPALIHFGQFPRPTLGSSRAISGGDFANPAAQAHKVQRLSA